MNFGGPLDNFSTVDEGESESFFDPPGDQTNIFTTWSSVVSARLDEYSYSGDGDIEVVYFWSVALADITLDLIIHDVLLVMGSVVFIFCYIWSVVEGCIPVCMLVRLLNPEFTK